ncbi:MAG: SDR family oxidoreductase [Propionibacteriaceae bacterium]|jgi:NAD(P)-dependent dehydrogenase (short-subunit alcohol dehydrogenase family)|nr:SDR family oxidoreductase [Propionibacteriaceae bacterium]
MKSTRLTGDVAVVTGAASGIDRGVALELSRHGALVACADIDDAGNAQTTAAIAAEGGQAFGVHMDIGDSESVKTAFAEIYERTGKISILVHGAAVVRFSQLAELTDDEWAFVMNINLTGAMRVLREVYPYMKQGGGGRIVQISSTSGKSGGNWAGPHYVAAKAGVIGLTRYCANTWVKDGIRANAICPGTTETPLTSHEETAAAIGTQLSKVPMGRIGQPADIAGVVMFLVSDESAYVTGITVDVTGGRYIYNN